MAPSYNNAVAASARLRRAPVHTALKLWCGVSGWGIVWRSVAGDRSCVRRVGNLRTLADTLCDVRTRGA